MTHRAVTLGVSLLGIAVLLAACGGDGGLILPTFRLERAS